MRTKIYQINSKRDVNRVKFEGLDLLERYQGSSAVDPSIYDEVFNAEIDETDLEAIYQRFNTVGHPLHRGHSLSVSDVVVNDNGAFFCDSIGFQPIAFDESQTQKPDNLMRVVYVEPHKAPYIADVAHTLEAEQKAVGDGLIERLTMMTVPVSWATRNQSSGAWTEIEGSATVHPSWPAPSSYAATPAKHSEVSLTRR